jgi:hypothetical protein
MSFSDFVPSLEYKRFEEQHGDDTFIKLNLLYIAFDMNELYDENIMDHEFDDLCEDVLEISLNEDFERFNIIDIADAVVFIINDSNYTVKEYETVYKSKQEKILEELLSYLESAKEPDVEDYTE